MKTNQEMIRIIDSFSVIQRTSDGYFDGSELLRQWNSVSNNPRRQMSKFLEMVRLKNLYLRYQKMKAKEQICSLVKTS